VGLDRITKYHYGKYLEQNLERLVNRLHNGSYRPKLKRGVLIPKSNGKTRLIAVGAFEDKLVEWVLAKILTSLYEPIFANSSCGFRPNKNALEAVKIVYSSLFRQKNHAHVVDIDIARFFDSVSHRKLTKLIEKRIHDRKVMSLISRLL
jgi:RNA-directed DNA polymerase